MSTPPPPRRARPGQRHGWRRAWVRWLAGTLAVGVLVTVTVAVFAGRAATRQQGDPRSALPGGTAALAQLLDAEGVRVIRTSTVADTVDRLPAGATLVVAFSERLAEADARRLAQSPRGRLILLRPPSAALTRFAVAATARPAQAGIWEPACAEPAAVRAGAIRLTDLRASYATSGTPALACYPVGDGHAWLRVPAPGGPVDLVGGGISNAALGDQGNAAFAMSVFGAHPTVVWLMAPRPEAAEATAEPTLLPPWWSMAAVQAGLAVVVLGIWRGRRLGPLLAEPLPVTVRASETVEGHGRLYYRIGARDRAAEALRAGTRTRLGAVFGHAEHPEILAGVVAARTGRDPRQVRHLLAGPAPATDDALVGLGRDLDHLEQEARQL